MWRHSEFVSPSFVQFSKNFREKKLWLLDSKLLLATLYENWVAID
jgi:hypothetical protein